MIREPQVAGKFYPSNRNDLLDALQTCIPIKDQKERVLGILAPHAGYVYSGKIAGDVYSRIKIPDTVVLACPNHTGVPVDFSVWSKGQWQTPLGMLPIEETLADKILTLCSEAQNDQRAHLGEHANEVHLPFLQQLNPNVKIVPIVIRTRSLDRLKKFGLGLAKAVQEFKEEVLIIASSDMTHFETHESAKSKDQLAIDKMRNLDEEGLWNIVNEHRITMCGVGPTVAMLTAIKVLGASCSEFIGYSTSGEVSGDFDRVVGYAGMIFK